MDIEVQKAALELFEGDLEAAERWLNTPAPALGNQRPADADCDDVLRLISQLEHAVFP